MKKLRLNCISDYYFQSAWELYEEAFPLEERRSIDRCSIFSDEQFKLSF
jgi:hypothetical protein